MAFLCQYSLNINCLWKFLSKIVLFIAYLGFLLSRTVSIPIISSRTKFASLTPCDCSGNSECDCSTTKCGANIMYVSRNLVDTFTADWVISSAVSSVEHSTDVCCRLLCKHRLVTAPAAPTAAHPPTSGRSFPRLSPYSWSLVTQPLSWPDRYQPTPRCSYSAALSPPPSP